MRKYILHIGSLFVLLAPVSSCYEDKGNYDYTEVRDAIVVIDEVEENKGTLVYDRYQSLVLSPKISIRDGVLNPEEYQFSWGLLNLNQDSDDYEPIKIIGTELDLDYDLIGHIPGDYRITLRIYNKRTTAVTYYTFDLVIASINGWLILEEDSDGLSDLSVIRDDQIVPGLNAEKHGITRNLYGTVTGEKFRNSKFLAWRAVTASNYAKYSRIFIFTDEGMYALDNNTYQLVSDEYSSLFSVQPSVYNPQGHYVNSPGTNQLEMLLNNGNIYTFSWSMMGSTGVFGTPRTVGSTISTFEPFLAPLPVTVSGARGVLYNTVDYPDGAFITVGQFANQYFEPTSADGIFNPNAINAGGKDYRLVYLGTANTHETGAIFVDAQDGDKPYLFHGDFQVTSEDPVIHGKYDLSSLPGINQATDYYFSLRGRVLYYVSGNKLYSWVFKAENVNEVHTFGAGEEVTCIKNYFNMQDETYSGKLLFVSTFDGNEGKVYKIPVNELSGVVNGEVEEYDGFGRILDMMLKL